MYKRRLGFVLLTSLQVAPISTSCFIRESHGTGHYQRVFLWSTLNESVVNGSTHTVPKTSKPTALALTVYIGLHVSLIL